MRRHAGWGLKAVLGIIAVTFVFYFGYNQISRLATGDATAIQVGGEEISAAWYRFFYNDEYERAKQQFQGQEIPDFYLKIIENQTRQRLVYRNLIRQFAEEVGLAVTDTELAGAIIKTQNFDPVEYKNFLQYFYQNNGFAYEDLVREDLLVAKFQRWAQGFNTAKPAAPQTTWTFEATLVEGKKRQSEKVGPITLKERHKLFELAPIHKTDDFLAIFSLTSANPRLTIPFKTGNEELQVRLVEKKRAAAKEVAGKEAAAPTESGPNLIDYWFREFANKIPVKSRLSQEAL